MIQGLWSDSRPLCPPFFCLLQRREYLEFKRNPNPSVYYIVVRSFYSLALYTIRLNFSPRLHVPLVRRGCLTHHELFHCKFIYSSPVSNLLPLDLRSSLTVSPGPCPFSNWTNSLVLTPLGHGPCITTLPFLIHSSPPRPFQQDFPVGSSLNPEYDLCHPSRPCRNLGQWCDH